MKPVLSFSGEISPSTKQGQAKEAQEHCCGCQEGAGRAVSPCIIPLCFVSYQLILKAPSLHINPQHT